MKPIPVALIIFWIILIKFPEIIAYLIWGLLIFIWVNMLIFMRAVKKWKQDYVKFWKYKIFR